MCFALLCNVTLASEALDAGRRKLFSDHLPPMQARCRPQRRVMLAGTLRVVIPV